MLEQMLTNVNKIMNVVLGMDVECTSTNHNSNDQRWLLQFNDCLKSLQMYVSDAVQKSSLGTLGNVQWVPPGRACLSILPYWTDTNSV